MDEPNKINCSCHGWQDEAFVCQHIFASLDSEVPVGFHWPPDSTNPHPDAWCTACDQARIDAGGDWTPEVEEKLNIKLLCGSCYENAKSIWSAVSTVTHT